MNKEEKALYMRAWNAKRTPEQRLRSKEYRAKQFKDSRNDVVQALGGCCAKCGFSDVRALQIDHVKGGGQRDRKSRGYNSGYNYTFYIKIMKDPDFKKLYQLLCANCNWIKRSENKEYNTGVANRPPRLYLAL